MTNKGKAIQRIIFIILGVIMFTVGGILSVFNHDAFDVHYNKISYVALEADEYYDSFTEEVVEMNPRDFYYMDLGDGYTYRVEHTYVDGLSLKFYDLIRKAAYSLTNDFKFYNTMIMWLIVGGITVIGNVIASVIDLVTGLKRVKVSAEM